MKQKPLRFKSPIDAWHQAEKKIARTIYNAHTELSDMVKTVKERDPAAKSSP